MNKMTFDEFIDAVQKDVRPMLSRSYRDAELRVVPFQKMNSSYVALQMENAGSGVVPNVNLTNLYRDYRDGIAFDRILKAVTEQLQSDPVVDAAEILDYSRVKEKLFIRVSDAEKNRDVLAKTPHKEVDGLAVTYHIQVQKGSDFTASTQVTNVLLEAYGITPEQLHADAIESGKILYPSRVEPLASVMMGMMGGGLDTDMVSFEDAGLVMISNTQGMNGAAALFYPGQMDLVAEKMGGDYMIIPSSVHELLVIRDDGTGYSTLETMVREVNSAIVSPEDQLSDHVYHYDAKDHVLEKAETFEGRMAQKKLEHEGTKEKTSVLQRLNDKKETLGSHPGKAAPNRLKDMML